MELDERIFQELKELYKKQENEGKLLSRQQLSTYYATFRNKFGPEKLANLDGEALLETMHSHGNKDSLVYWLEFKDDEEFPALFGSIAGGSAHKFGLFRKRETGVWTAGSPKSPIELSVEQAIDIARGHRDQLIKGTERLAIMPAHGSDAEYEQLQQDMQRIAPDVSDSAWGHKYFSLLYPDTLDDFHNPEYARFHLIKLLQLPPQTEGRYVCAGRYVAIADLLQMPLNTLTRLLNERDGRNLHYYWRIGTTQYKGKPREFWPAMRDGNFCAIGWAKVGDLSSIPRDNTGKPTIRAALQYHYGDEKPVATGKAASQLFDFRWNMNIGDLVLASDGASILGIGKVTDGYTYDPSSVCPHQHAVEWLSLEEWKQVDQIPDIEGKLTTVYRMKRHLNLLETEKHILATSTEKPEPIPFPPPAYVPLPSPRGALPQLTSIMGRIQTVLERKGQLILYGPPGTGKTYWAERTAYELAARASFGTTIDLLSAEQKATLYRSNHSRVRTCCFHPAYGYEDFLEGFRPEATDNSHMQFVPRNGIFKQLCLDACTSPREKFYLIIDEINRGDIPRIFGELLTVLEKDKRGNTILLPLTQEWFHVPDNVYIIGTMNTADRSIALLDAALRRRFGFIELMPDSQPLKKAEAGGIALGPWLDSLNARIRQYVGRDARNLQIGHAYLMEKGQPIADFTTLARVVQEDLLPLLEEYCYEDYNKLEQIMGSGLIDAKAQIIRHDLFELSQQANLVQALLAPCPEVTTSAQAAAAEEQQEAIYEDDTDENGNDDLDI